MSLKPVIRIAGQKNVWMLERDASREDEDAIGTTTYVQKKCRNGTYLYDPDCREPAQSVFFHPVDQHTKAPGISKVGFDMKDGSEVTLHGTWGKVENLFQDTGIDLREQYLTWGIISKEVKLVNWREMIYVDVIHMDDGEVLGSVDRVEDISQYYSDMLGIDLVYWSRSTAMSSGGKTTPARR